MTILGASERYVYYGVIMGTNALVFNVDEVSMVMFRSVGSLIPCNCS